MAEITLDAIREIMKEELEPVKADIISMKSDISSMKEDVEEIKEKVDAIDFWCNEHDKDIYILKKNAGLAMND